MRIPTADGIDHGDADGYILCPVLWCGGGCEECMEVFEKRQERFGE